MTVITVSSSWTFNADRLTKFADMIMDSIVQVFMTAGVPLPERKFFTVGTPVHDCEELVVVFQSVSKGFQGGGGEPSNCDQPSTALFEAHLVRCFPISQSGLTPPSGPELTSSADGLMQDAWLMLGAADELNRDPFTGLGGMVYSVAVGEPQGGYVGVVLSIEAMVP